MGKTIKPLLVLIFILTLTFIVKGQCKYIGPLDSAGYMDKKYDSTITWYWGRKGKSKFRVFYLNVHDTASKRAFVRMPITEKYAKYRLSLYDASSRKLKWSRGWSASADVLLSVFFVTLVTTEIGYGSNKSKLDSFVSANSDICLSSLLASMIFIHFWNTAINQSIVQYNLAQEKRNLAH